MRRRCTVLSAFTIFMMCLVFGSITHAQPFVAQPAGQHSSLVCWPDGAAAGPLGKIGIVFDFELAGALNASLVGGWSATNYQFNECYGGGMIDDIFHPAFAANLQFGNVCAASASQHNEWAFFLPFGCAGGAGYAWPYSWAVSPPPFTYRCAFLAARFLDPFGPGLGLGWEHPQYQSNGPMANAHLLGTAPGVKKAILFVGDNTALAEADKDLQRIRASLIGNGFLPANIIPLNGPGLPNLCPPPVLPQIPATRANLIGPGGAVPWLGLGGMPGDEYFLWFHDHGSRWLFALGPGGTIKITSLTGENFTTTADNSFADQVQPTAWIYIESESEIPSPVSVTLNAQNVFSGDLQLGDNVIEFYQGIDGTIIEGLNTINVFNDSPTSDIDLSAVALGTGAVPLQDESVAFDTLEAQEYLRSYQCDNTEKIPTMSEWGLVVLMALILATGVFVWIRRRRLTTAG